MRDDLSERRIHTLNPALANQIAVAEKIVGSDLRLHAVRPGLVEGETTRVMFADPTLGPSENRAIFIDPVSLAVLGDMTVYGTSGILPLRQTIDYLHGLFYRWFSDIDFLETAR